MIKFGDKKPELELETSKQIQDTTQEQVQDILAEQVPTDQTQEIPQEQEQVQVQNISTDQVQETFNQDIMTNLENEMKMGKQDFGGVQNMKLDYIDNDHTLLDLMHTEKNDTFKKNANILFHYITETNALAKSIYLDFTTSLLGEDLDIEKEPNTSGGKRRKKTRHHKKPKKHKKTRRM